MGKNWAGPFFPHPDKVKQQPCSEGYRVGKYCRAYGKSSAEKHSQLYPVMNTHVTFAFYGVGKNWAGQFFPHLDKVKHQPYAQAYQVGKKLLCIWLILCGKTQPNLPYYEYTCDLCFLGGGEKLGRPILSPPLQG